MKIEQIYTECLAQGAYYITSNGEAAIIDPLRETEPYLDRLSRDGVTLKYIFETHFHADFVSGHYELSQKTGAPIVYGPNANPDFEVINAIDNQEFKVGNATIKVLHTPGHTMESACFLLIDQSGKDIALFSGDTLFLGDVGRPDLAQKSADKTQEDLAGILYDSLYDKILPLSDDIIVYPAHGAGSACGKNMMKETVDTLGNQKKTNYALNQPNKEAFIHAVLEGLTAPPAYFGMNVKMNKTEIHSNHNLAENKIKSLSIDEFENASKNKNTVILDTRSSVDFANGFVPKSINIGIKGDFAPWVGTILGNVDQNIVLVTDEGMEEETITRLARVGFDHIIGYLENGFKTWSNSGKEIDKIDSITAKEFENKFIEDQTIVLDLRKESEYSAEHVNNSFNRPLASINDWLKEFENENHYYIHCQGGYRSMIAASILRKNGFKNFTDISGGFKAILDTKIPKTDFVCKSKIMA